MGTRVPFLGPPIMQVGGQKFLTRNQVMRSLLGHLGKDSFLTFRGFRPPMVCPMVRSSNLISCSTDKGCSATGSPCFFSKITKAAVEGGYPIVSAKTIIKRLDELKKSYSTALKKQNTMTEEQEQLFMASMESTFDIFKDNWQNEIDMDESLSEEAKARKVQVMRDYLEEGGTKSLPVLPEAVSPEMERTREDMAREREEMARLVREREMRQAKELERRRLERGEGSRGQGAGGERSREVARDRSPLRGDLRRGRRRREGNEDDDEGLQDDMNNDVGDKDYDPGDPKDNIIKAEVPDNIVELTTLLAMHERTSVRQQAVMTAGILTAQGGSSNLSSRLFSSISSNKDSSITTVPTFFFFKRACSL